MKSGGAAWHGQGLSEQRENMADSLPEGRLINEVGKIVDME
jgi:hypothetical protein